MTNRKVRRESRKSTRAVTKTVGRPMPYTASDARSGGESKVAPKRRRVAPESGVTSLDAPIPYVPAEPEPIYAKVQPWRSEEQRRRALALALHAHMKCGDDTAPLSEVRDVVEVQVRHGAAIVLGHDEFWKAYEAMVDGDGRPAERTPESFTAEDYAALLADAAPIREEAGTIANELGRVLLEGGFYDAETPEERRKPWVTLADDGTIYDVVNTLDGVRVRLIGRYVAGVFMPCQTTAGTYSEGAIAPAFDNQPFMMSTKGAA